MKQEKNMVWITIDKDRNGIKHYRVYESLEEAKEKKLSSEKGVQIVRGQSKNELRKLAEFACMLMDDPRYYRNENKLLEDFFKYKQKQETLQPLKKTKEEYGDDLEL